jgi:hypothetical protein
MIGGLPISLNAFAGAFARSPSSGVIVALPSAPPGDEVAAYEQTLVLNPNDVKAWNYLEDRSRTPKKRNNLIFIIFNGISGKYN